MRVTLRPGEDPQRWKPVFGEHLVLQAWGTSPVKSSCLALPRRVGRAREMLEQTQAKFEGDDCAWPVSDGVNVQMAPSRGRAPTPEFTWRGRSEPQGRAWLDVDHLYEMDALRSLPGTKDSPPT